MPLFGFFTKKNRRAATGLKPGQKVDFKPSIAYNPKKNVGKASRSTTRLQRKGFKWKSFFVTLVGIGVIILVISLMNSVFTSSSVKVKSFELLGNRTINDAQVLAVLDKFRDQSIFTLNTSLIEEELQAEFNIFNGVWVKKYYPDTLNIRISEREPRLVYINLSGAFLVDANGQVLRKIFVDPVVMTDEKLNIARGFGDPNSEYLFEIFLNDFKINNQALDLAPEELKLLIESAFNFDNVSLIDKKNKLDLLEAEYKQELLTLWMKVNQAVDVSVYSTYPRVDSIDTTVYEEDDLIDITRLNITTDLLNLFSSRKIQTSRMVWEGELLIRVTTADEKELVFSSVRKITEQFEDYIMVMNQLQKEGKEYCQIDLSGIKIAVRSCR